MKNLSMILAAFSIGTAPVQTESPSNSPLPQVQIPQVQILPKQEAESEPKLGAEAVASIRTAYDKGEYDQFLKELDDTYQASQENGELDALAAARPGASSSLQKWGILASDLQTEKREKLLEAVQNHDESLFVKKVKSAAAKLSNEEQDIAIDRIASFRQMTLGKGSNSDENLLIALDLEYEYKALNVSNSGSSKQERREKQCALKMDKMECLQHLSKQFQDPSLKEAVVIYTKQFDARLAQSWDMADLNQLANGNIKPSSAIEEKIASILQVYQEKFSDLTKQFIAEHEKN